MALIGRSLEKHMRRSPIPDDDIRGGLEYGLTMIHQILETDGDQSPLASSSLDVADVRLDSDRLVIPADIEPFTPVEETA